MGERKLWCFFSDYDGGVVMKKSDIEFYCAVFWLCMFVVWLWYVTR